MTWTTWGYQCHLRSIWIEDFTEIIMQTLCKHLLARTLKIVIPVWQDDFIGSFMQSLVW